MKKTLLVTLALLLAVISQTQTQAQTTLLHYRVNDGDDLSNGGVPNLGTLGNGVPTPTNLATLTLSTDIPPSTLGVPPNAGNRSLFFRSIAGEQGIVSPGTQQLLNSDVFAAGGFTFEAWFRAAGGTLNSIIDYAGTEKLRRVTGTIADPSMASMFTNGTTHDIGLAASGEWHYAAVVFRATSFDEPSGFVVGQYDLYFDGNLAPVSTVNVAISNLGDTLIRSIGVGMHPEGFTDDFFAGRIYEPRVTLGALDRGQLLFRSEIIVNTTDDEDDGPGSLTDLSLREAINHAPAGSLITFDPSLSGKTIVLTTGAQLTINKSLTIDATSLPGGLTIDANGATTGHRVMEISSGSTVILDSLTLTGGVSSSGGAISVIQDATLSLNACTLSGNSASSGGGISNNNGTLNLNACTLSGNSASGEGGGIFNTASTLDVSTATLTLTACTLSGNSAGSSGGGVMNRSGLAGNTVLNLRDSIIAGNTAPTGADLQREGGANTNTNNNTGTNLIGDVGNSGIGIVPGRIGNSSSPIDPKLASLGHYGGPTQTMHPLAGSPAIFTTGNVIRTDQRGFTLTGPETIGAVQIPTPTKVSNETTLRNALLTSATEPGKVICFDQILNGGTITLSSTQLEVPGTANGLFIDASDLVDGLTIDANGSAATPHRVMEIQPGAIAALHGLTMTGGRTADGLGSGSGGGGDNGGGIFAASNSILTLSSCNITGNQTGGGGQGVPGGLGALGGFGGGIFADANTTLSLTSCTITGNQTGGGGDGGDDFGGVGGFGGQGGGGGGIYANGNTTLTSCTITGNQTGSGGQGGQGDGSLGNDGGGDGGGICYDGLTLKISHCTIVGNHANDRGRGGGILYRKLGVVLTASIVADNVGKFGNDIEQRFFGNVVTGSDSYVGDLNGWNRTSVPLSSANGSINLAPLGDYGGPTQTMIPLPGSPAIDAATGSTRSTDQRGFAITDGTPDIGAAEFRGSTDFPFLAPTLWEIDHDGDGNTFGIEFALGTDPFLSDPNHPNNLTIDLTPSGEPVLSFGYNATAAPFATWILERSTDLNTWTILNTNPDPGGDSTITDDTDPIDLRTFYRFRAELVE